MKLKPSERIKELGRIMISENISSFDAIEGIMKYLDEVYEAEQKEIEKGGITPKVNGLDNVVLCKEPQIEHYSEPEYNEDKDLISDLYLKYINTRDKELKGITDFHKKMWKGEEVFAKILIEYGKLTRNKGIEDCIEMIKKISWEIKHGYESGDKKITWSEYVLNDDNLQDLIKLKR